MIGKSLRERHGLGALSEARAIALVREVLDAQAAHLVEVRAQDPGMIACLVVRADDATVRLCRTIGFDMKPGGTGVFGLMGADAAEQFSMDGPRRAWLETPCRPRETKVLLLAGGTALLSLKTSAGTVAITVALVP